MGHLLNQQEMTLPSVK